MIRNVTAIVAGLIAGSIFNMALVSLSHAVYPLPDGIDPNDFEAFRDHVQANGMPTGALLIVLVAHAGGSFVSGLVCGLIAKRTWYIAAAALGVLWMCGGITMLMMLPAPMWFAVADTVLYVPVALLGVRLGGTLVGPPPQPPTDEAYATLALTDNLN
ncbi:hypothetical protein Enr13x_02790 [Stieleria neptunia]|uniref:Uncharacterized protein n=1 Tax=Stieleria neptunia TaxID=2527979 RepID=A0A518HI02_9BACT|nr:hypothetical protein [Stieleria neptunia]QDV40473.1 hypothetical protein Enr13x_02790 [Stieleria neptunia]